MLQTDGYGTAYFSSIETGTHEITVEHSSYVAFSGTVSITKNTPATRTISLVSSGTGTVSGTITNASTGTPLAEVTLNIRKGWDNVSGQPKTTLTTNASGQYTLSTDAGYYTVEMVKSNFATTHFNITVLANKTTVNQNGSISPTAAVSGQCTVVLTWGKDPGDLDSHLVGRLGDGLSFHVYFGNRDANNSQGKIAAQLDVDDINGEGPETVTFPVDTRGTYEYYVHWYGGSGTWATSGATVKLQFGGTSKTFTVPASNTSGGQWNVFKISNGILMDVDVIE